MEEMSLRVQEALASEEALAERFANTVRIVLISMLTLIALVNSGSVSREANAMNLGIIATGFLYGMIIHGRVKRGRYTPHLKYITSFLDILLVNVLLFMYTIIELPSVALKNYVFFVNYPMLLLTTFRFDRKLTLLTGIWALVLYLGLLGYLTVTNAVTLQHQGYVSELFSREVTIIGQMTKVVIFAGFIALATYLAQYSRNVIVKTISNEVTHRMANETMVRELEIASQVQRTLLPRVIPVVPRLEIYGTVLQGTFVGGDYVDFLSMPGPVLRVVIADVSGKGVPAALIMAEVRASTHLLTSMHLPLDELARQLNTLVRNSTESRVFVTCLAVDIDTASGMLQYVNAGHPRAYVHTSGATVALSARTFALGALEALPQLSVNSVAFAPGSTLVAYTDGIFEYAGGGSEQYGEERLRQSIVRHASAPVEEIARSLLGDVKAFGGMKPFDDDVALAIVKHG